MMCLKRIFSPCIRLCIRASLVAQLLKNLPAMQKTWVWSLGWEDPLGEGMATHSSILAWRIPWTEEPVGLQSMGSQRVRQDWEIKTGYAFNGTLHEVTSSKSENFSWIFLIFHLYFYLFSWLEFGFPILPLIFPHCVYWFVLSFFSPILCPFVLHSEQFSWFLKLSIEIQTYALIVSTVIYMIVF